MASAIITTAFGNLQINSTKTGVTELFFTEKEAAGESISDAIINTTVKQISEFIEHKRTAFDIPLDLNGTPFQRSMEIGAQHSLWLHHFLSENCATTRRHQKS